MSKKHAVTLLCEEWRPIEGWPLHEVSNFGRVRKKGYKAAKGYRYKGKLVTWIKEKIFESKGERDVELWDRGRFERFSYAELVLTVFVEPRPKKRPIARHLDDNTANNRLDNLSWGTRRDNRLDAVRNGIQSAGSPWAKKIGAKNRGQKRTVEQVARIRDSRKDYFRLTEKQVLAIRSTPDYYGVVADLAVKFGVSRSLISGVRGRHIWKHI